MSSALPPGPYRNVRLSDGTEAPFYVIPFDKRGVCVGPRTRQHLIDALRAGQYSDVFLFSHGWNNDWTVATDRYEHFLHGYMSMRQERKLPMPPDYRPLLVGIFWPSTGLVFTASEKGPAIAGGDPTMMDADIADQLDELAALAEELTPAQSGRLYAMAQKETLNEAESFELAELLQPLFSKSDDELASDVAVSSHELLKIWEASAAPEDLDDFGTGGAGDSGPLAAGLIGNVLKKLDPRPVLRAATLYQMKDRAGRVGFHGVGPLLTDLLGSSSARVHLVGHSYGGKIVLSAASFGDTLPRKVESMLLLQPAVSHLCFAAQVPKSSKPGGYQRVLERVNRPILSTFSKHDFALTRAFHFALRRADDLGEARIAAEPGQPPSKYAALGGFGPRGAGEVLQDMQAAGSPYVFDPQVRLYGLRADRTIGGHGDISNESTWWALYNLTSR